jgi:hypothetical protein
MGLAGNIKRLIRNNTLFEHYFAPVRAESAIRRWRRDGKPVPAPHIVKQRYIHALTPVFGLKVMVETGTNTGSTVKALENHFDEIYSIEIYPPLAQAAKIRFASNPAIHIIEGDSASVLPSILQKVSEPILFWLDGHYSGQGTGRSDVDTPVLAELEHILALRPRGKDVILIDDARCFVGANGYPHLRDFLASIEQQFGVRPHVADDIIFILPA